MNNEERNRLIAAKLEAGLSLSDVQKLLAEEHGVTMTYLDLRLLAADLEVNWQKHDEASPREAKTVAPPDLSAAEETVSRTQISVSKVIRPGAAMSGDVEFASGAKAEWFVDAMGRLGLNPAPGSSRPTEQDLQEFQAELQRKISGGGH